MRWPLVVQQCPGWPHFQVGKTEDITSRKVDQSSTYIRISDLDIEAEII